MDNQNFVICKNHTDSPTGFVYVQMLDDNSLLYTKNILESTKFLSHDEAYDFIDEWNLKGQHTAESVTTLLLESDAGKLLNPHEFEN